MFIPPAHYDQIQKIRQQGNWTVHRGISPVNNFRRQFRSLLKRAGISEAKFHDLRRTCLSNWLAHGLNELDVMNMAGHSSFTTTHTFYLAVKRDLIDRARAASHSALASICMAKVWQVPFSAPDGKSDQSQVTGNQGLRE